ncbi:ABC transporter ATP-binding protein [Anianabacter salinae]|uniref:ABC transporter ATP-binding protein n=1 Tax=Anianabacter salinae TaxID=2851023 RepID=UPI00225DEF65|nr:ABC transporter ATP-binding protein [Anianabacter salinae]MBV0913771.1 ABC transporter ATP-binding protein [Anianabacter salinae]
MSFLTLDGVTRQWKGQGGVQGISLALPRGEFLSILGPSGCGKSTLLRLIAGLEQPQAGRIVIDGRDVTALPASARNLSMVFQSYALFPHLSVAENVIFGLKVRRVGRAEREQRLAEVLTMTGLDGLERRKPSELSGGQRQRVALARAAVAERPLCLMDEPLSNLDARLRHSVRRDIRDLARKLGLTVVYVTHDQGEAMSLSNTVVLMQDGRVEQVGTPSDLYSRPATTFAAQFIGEPPMSLIEGPALGYPDEVTVGIRPENVRLAAAGGGDLDTVVADIEFLGGDTRLELDQSAARGLAVMLPGAAHIGIGETVGVTIPEENRLLFNSVTGKLEKEPQQNPKARNRQIPAPEDGQKAPPSPKTVKEDL